MELAGATAVVTGAGSGIGRASARAFAEQGASVFVTDIVEDAGRETVELIEQAGGTAAFSQVDVTDKDQLSRMLDEAEQLYGGVDVLHNNAGIVCGEPHWPQTDPDTLLCQVMINLGSVIVGTRLAVPYLSRRGGGAIVNTASMASVLPLAEEPAYSATKAGVLMFTRTCAALETTHKVRVTAVLPGLIETPLLQKSGDGARPAAWVDLAKSFMGVQPPSEVADVVIELAKNGTGGEWRFVTEVAEPLLEMIRMGMP